MWKPSPSELAKDVYSIELYDFCSGDSRPKLVQKHVNICLNLQLKIKGQIS